MAKTARRVHYRVARKEIDGRAEADGVILIKIRKNKELFAVGALLLITGFIKGAVLTALFCRRG